MSPHLEFSPANQALIDQGRALVTQKIGREADAIDARHELLTSDEENPEGVRLAGDAYAHARLMVDAAFLELYGIFLDLARAEVAAEQQQAA